MVDIGRKNFKDPKLGKMSLHLTFKPSGAANFELDFDGTATISDVKEKCSGVCGIEKDQQKIIFKGMLYERGSE